MPNYVFNRLKIHGKPDYSPYLTEGEFDFNKIIPMPKSLEGTEASSAVPNGLRDLYEDAIKKNDQELAKGIDDLSRNIYNKPITEIEETKYDALRKNGENFKIAKRAYAAYCECRYVDWYDWSVDHWNTKWNAMKTFVGNEVVYFDTAWDAPLPVIEQLSKDLGDTKVELWWADEAVDENVGHAIFVNGDNLSPDSGFLEPGTDEHEETIELCR